jgi:signal transduction histidine kinase
MTGLVADLLTLARADSSQPLAIGDVELGALVAEVTAQAARAHPARRFYTRTVTARVRGDAESLRRLVWILVDNAVAHAPGAQAGQAQDEQAAQIWATVSVEGATAVVQVADDGSGIPEDMRERIFDRFVRARTAAGGPEGSGLGLAIARSVVQAHGGRIWAGNNGAGGATFTIRLPLADGSQNS